jgi:type II secretory pathway pseudopilin PulG
MKNGLSFTEVIIAFSIISILLASFFNWILNYLITLNTIKERLIALSLAQEGLELAIALRNKAYETDTDTDTDTDTIPNWLGNNIDLNSSYCLKLETSTGEIMANSTTDINSCKVYNYNNIDFHRLISYSSDTDYVIGKTSTIVNSKVNFLNQTVELKTILVNWKTF